MARPIAAGFGAAFRQAYTDAGLTQAELAEELRARGWVKVDQSRVSQWARGVLVPPVDILPDVDDICGHAKGYVLELAGFVDSRALCNEEPAAPLASRRRARRPAGAGRTPRAV